MPPEYILITFCFRPEEGWSDVEVDRTRIQHEKRLLWVLNQDSSEIIDTFCWRNKLTVECFTSVVRGESTNIVTIQRWDTALLQYNMRQIVYNSWNHHNLTNSRPEGTLLQRLMRLRIWPEERRSSTSTIPDSLRPLSTKDEAWDYWTPTLTTNLWSVQWRLVDHGLLPCMARFWGLKCNPCHRTSLPFWVFPELATCFRCTIQPAPKSIGRENHVCNTTQCQGFQSQQAWGSGIQKISPRRTVNHSNNEGMSLFWFCCHQPILLHLWLFMDLYAAKSRSARSWDTSSRACWNSHSGEAWTCHRDLQAIIFLLDGCISKAPGQGSYPLSGCQNRESRYTRTTLFTQKFNLIQTMRDTRSQA